MKNRFFREYLFYNKIYIIFISVWFLFLSCNPFSRDEKDNISSETLNFIEPELIISQTFIDESIPEYITDYSLWKVRWKGSKPSRVKLERYRRDNCYVYSVYVPENIHKFRQVSFKRSEEVGKKISLNEIEFLNFSGEVIDGDRWISQNDAAGRPFWGYRKEAGEIKNFPDTEILVNVFYFREPCVLPVFLEIGNLPFKRIPAAKRSEK